MITPITLVQNNGLQWFVGGYAEIDGRSIALGNSSVNQEGTCDKNANRDLSLCPQVYDRPTRTNSSVFRLMTFTYRTVLSELVSSTASDNSMQF